MPNVTIRSAAPTDLPQMASLWHEKAVLQHQVDRRFTLLPDGPARWSEAAAGWLASDQYRVLAAEREEAIIGYIVGMIEAAPPGLTPERVGLVVELVINVHVQQHGLGRQLLDSLRPWFAEQQLVVMIARVPRRGAVEQAFWRASGATEWFDYMWMKI